MTLTLDPVQAAEQEAVQAQALAVGLEAKLKTGSGRVTAAQLAKARQEAEHAALRAQGAKAAAEREEAEARLTAGRQLFEEWREAGVASLLDAAEKFERAGTAINEAINAVDSLNDTHTGFKQKWAAHFGSDLQNDAALAFKFGNRSGGDWGAIDQHHGIRKLEPIRLLAALIVDLTRARDKNTMGGIERGLRTQLDQGPHNIELRQFRKVAQHFKEKEKK